MVSLTQPLAWDLPLTNKISESVSDHATKTMLGTVTLVEKVVETAANGSSAKSSTRRSTAKKVADVLLRYNFPAAGLTDDALRTLILMVLVDGRGCPRCADRLTSLSAHSAAHAEYLDVWLTSEKPCSRATRRPTSRPGRPAPRPWSRTRGTPGGGGGVRSSAGTPTRRCRCAACRPVRRRPSTAGCGTRWSGRCPRRGGAVRRAVPGRTGTRRGSPAAPRSPRAAWWTRTAGAVPLTGYRPRRIRRRGPPRRPRSRRGGGRRGGRAPRGPRVRLPPRPRPSGCAGAG